MGESPLESHHVQFAGQGSRPMMFAHGYGCDQTMWRFLAPHFEDQFQKVSFDHLGFGKSDPTAAHDFALSLPL